MKLTSAQREVLARLDASDALVGSRQTRNGPWRYHWASDGGRGPTARTLAALVVAGLVRSTGDYIWEQYIELTAAGRAAME